MQVNFIRRGKHNLSYEEFSSYVGHLPEFVPFYLDSAVQLVETSLCKSFSDHELEVRLIDEYRKILPYGPVKQIKKLNKISCDGSKVELSTKYSRLVGDEIYLPVNDYGWSINYLTESSSIGPMDKLEIFRVGELLINGEYICTNTIRKNLDHHRSKIYGTHSREF